MRIFGNSLFICFIIEKARNCFLGTSLVYMVGLIGSRGWNPFYNIAALFDLAGI